MKSLSLLAAAFLFNLSLNAQQIYSGQVMDGSTKESLPGVNIIAKGTTRGTSTDVNGRFSIEAQDGETLIFSFVGYTSMEVSLSAQTELKVALQSDATQIEEIVVMGYFDQKKKDLTGAVSIVNAEDISKTPYANVLQNLAGRVAGITISQDGQPGSGRTQIRIRGITTLNSNNPLLVIDGISTNEPIDNLNPNDIESMQVLKDASSTAIYGVQAAGGVIIITTKKGKAGNTTIDAGVTHGVQTLAKKIEVLDATEWGQVYWKAAAYSGRIPNIDLYGGKVSEPVVVTTPFNVPNGQVYTFTPKGTDWGKSVYSNAITDQYYANITSGSEKGNFGLGFSYFDQKGLINTTYYKRLTARVNSSYKLAEWVSVGENLSISWSKQVQTGSQDSQSGIPYQALRQHPALPIYDVNGNYAGGNTFVAGLAFPNSINPVSSLDRAKDNTSDSYRIFGNAYIEANLFKAFKNIIPSAHDLTVKSSIGVDYSNFFARNFNPTFNEGGFINTVASYANNFGDGITLTWVNTLEYKFTTEKHAFRFLAGNEAKKYRARGLGAANTNYAIQDPNYVQIGSGTGGSSGNGGTQDWGLLSYFGRADYSYDGRYLVSATVRQDKTSRLNYTGYFPAFSFGWNLSNEKFLRDYFSGQALNSSKLRLSWGKQGNQNVGSNPYSIYSTFGINRDRADYDILGNNTSVSTGYITATKGNPNLRWETTTQTNIGLDVGVFKSFTLSIDYFIKRTADILTVPRVIAADGEGFPSPKNTATIDNKGFDLTLTHDYQSASELTVTTQLQVSKYTNKVVALGDGVGSIGYDGERYLSFDDARAATGHSFASFYGWVADGIFQNEDEVLNSPAQTGKAIGRLRYQDLNEDQVIDDKDRTYLGSPNPKITLGLNTSANYKNFSLTLFFYSALGQKVYNYTKQNTDFFEANFNTGKRILDAWTPENPGSSIPAVQLTATNDERRASSYFVESASYLRIRSLKLGYLLPVRFTKKLKVNVFAEVQNLWTISKYTGVDPEVPYAGNNNISGIDRGFYPMPRTYYLGINIRM
jgi:TonB-dependent starch-binding outer membrane protein SusC